MKYRIVELNNGVFLVLVKNYLPWWNIVLPSSGPSFEIVPLYQGLIGWGPDTLEGAKDLLKRYLTSKDKPLSIIAEVEI